MSKNDTLSNYITRKGRAPRCTVSLDVDTFAKLQVVAEKNKLNNAKTIKALIAFYEERT
jgi:hypothetical protein